MSLDTWFNGSIYQNESDIALRESNGTFVASGVEFRGKKAEYAPEEKRRASFIARADARNPTVPVGPALPLPLPLPLPLASPSASPIRV